MQSHAKFVCAFLLSCFWVFPLGADDKVNAETQVPITVSVQAEELSVNQDQAIAAAAEVMYRYMRSFNAQDPVRWADTMLFPHIRVSSGSVVVHASKQEFVQQMDFAAFSRRNNWRRSAWDSIDVVQVGANKVHMAVQFSRYDAQQQPIASFESLYVLQKDSAGRWGIRARSSFAP